MAERPIDQDSAGLYQAILSRRSVRRYEERDVPEETRRSVVEFALRIRPLLDENVFSYSLRPIAAEGATAAERSEELAVIMGGYGRMVSARRLLLPRMKGAAHVLEDFGYRTQQLVIEMTRLGLGTCWIAALGHEAEALDRFGCGPGERIPGVVVFGYPATSAGGRGFNQMIRAAIGAHREMPFSRFCFAGTWGTAAGLSPDEEKLMDALRHSPSAGNSRPWQVVLRKGTAYYGVRTDTGYYRLAKAVRLGYHLLDAGIGMANVSLALQALGRETEWEMVGDDPETRRVLNLPSSVQLVAALRLE